MAAWVEYIGAGPPSTTNSHWTGALDMFWDGDSWIYSGGWNAIQPVGGWDVGFQPPQIRVTYTDTGPIQLRIHDGTGWIVDVPGYVSGTPVPIPWGVNDLATLNFNLGTPALDVISIEFYDLSATTSSSSTTTTTTSSSTSTSTSISTTTSSTTTTTSTTAPFSIVNVVPDDESSGIALNALVTATFNRALDPLTVANDTFVVALRSYRTLDGETVRSNELVAGTITVEDDPLTPGLTGNRIVFCPTSPFFEQADYNVVIDDEVMSVFGEELGIIYGWNFQTGIVEEVPDEPSEPQIEPPLKDHYPRELDGLTVVSTYPAPYAAQVPLDLSPNNGVITIQWNHPIASIGASNVAWEALNGDSNLVESRHNAAHTIVIDEDLVNISVTSPLVENSMVRVTLQDVRDAEDRLDREYILFFATVINPAYATIEVIRALVGPFVDRVPDTTIAMLILEASLTADGISNSVIVNPALYELAKRKWVQCSVAYDLLFPTMVESAGKMKRLAEMQVEWQGISPREKILMYDSFQACIDKWEEILKSGGTGVRAIQTIKGLTDPDRPITGRNWTRRPSAAPYANMVVPKVVGRRGVKAPRSPRRYIYGSRRGVVYRGGAD